jgi:UDP-N-acetylglucosamine 2-epimerase (non-hydrolysing)
MMGQLHLASVVGARPNFIKLAALHHAFIQRPEITHSIIHTGQHYDYEMSQQFFDELGIPAPDHHLGIGSGSQSEQVGRTMIALEPVLESLRSDWVIIVGDVNATAAAALVAKKIGLRLAHVEAGLRSFDWAMPEEINRIVADRLSDLLFASEQSGVDNLKAEGVEETRVRFVGNVMIDTLLRFLPTLDASNTISRLSLEAGQFAIVTLHRPSNTDNPDRLAAWMKTFAALSRRFPVVFPVHPRTRSMLDKMKYTPPGDSLHLIEPLGYFDMIALMKHARLALTDSGGVQEETTAMGVSCLTLRANTERPATIHQGTNLLAGDDPDGVLALCDQVLANPPQRRLPDLWDGNAANRVADHLIHSATLEGRSR